MPEFESGDISSTLVPATKPQGINFRRECIFQTETVSLLSMLQTAGPILTEGVKMAWGLVTANEFLTFLVGGGLAMWGFSLFKKAKRAAR